MDPKMDTKLYLIHGDDYIGHINGQINMYDLLLTLVRDARELLLDGEQAALLRTLAKFEHRANEEYRRWRISDAYLLSRDPEDLGELMSAELLEADEDEGCSVSERMLHPCCMECGAAPACDGSGEDGIILDDEAAAFLTMAAKLLEAASKLTDTSAALLQMAQDRADGLTLDVPDEPEDGFGE